MGHRFQVAGVISAADWSARLDPTSTIAGDPVLVLDVSPMSTYACLVAGGMSPDGRPHVETAVRRLDARLPPWHRLASCCWVPLWSRRGFVTVWIVQGSAAEALVPRPRLWACLWSSQRADYAAACVVLRPTCRRISGRSHQGRRAGGCQEGHRRGAVDVGSGEVVDRHAAGWRYCCCLHGPVEADYNILDSIG